MTSQLVGCAMQPLRKVGLRPALCSQAWWLAGCGPVWGKRRRVRGPVVVAGAVARITGWLPCCFGHGRPPRGPVKRSRGSGLLPGVSWPG